jgi:tetratricopeptide (TPR) repeat protein
MNEQEKEKQFSDLDFEIDFYERLLKEKPRFVQALIALGEAYTKKGFFKKGLLIDTRLAKLRPHDATVRYNLACSYSLLGEIEKALQQLRLSIRLGYADFEHMDKDPDLENLRQDPRYKQFVFLSKNKTKDLPR